MAVRLLSLLVAGGRGPAAAAAVGLPVSPADHFDHHRTVASLGRNSLELKHTPSVLEHKSSGLVGHSSPSEVVLLDVEPVQDMERVLPLHVAHAQLNPIELALLHLRTSWASELEHSMHNSPPDEVEPDTLAQLALVAEQGHDTGTEILLAHLAGSGSHAARRGRLLDGERGGGTEPAAPRATGRLLDEQADSNHALRKWPVVFITGAQLAWWALPPTPPCHPPQRPLHSHGLHLHTALWPPPPAPPP